MQYVWYFYIASAALCCMMSILGLLDDEDKKIRHTRLYKFSSVFVIPLIPLLNTAICVTYLIVSLKEE